MIETTTTPQSPPLIDQHGLVGDLHTTALVSNDGTVDFLCLPDADSPTIFASILDPQIGGSFAAELTDVAADDVLRCRQNYLPNTNILISRLQAGGAVTE